MPKTYLGPERQWRNTVALVERWQRSVQPLVHAVNELWEIARSGHTYTLAEISERYEEIREDFVANSRSKRAVADLELMSGRWGETWTLGETWRPGIVQWSDRRLVKGDFVLVMFANGTHRHPIWTVTTKGRRISGYYYDTSRGGISGTIIRLHEVPGELVGRQLSDPDPQMFFSTLRTGNRSASG